MSELARRKTFLSEFVEKGLVCVYRGGFIAIHNRASIMIVIDWLKRHFFARPDKNAKAPYYGNQRIFFGQADSLPIEVVEADADPMYTSLGLRCGDWDVFMRVKAYLISDEDFIPTEMSRGERNQILFSSKLGFAIQLIWSDVLPQDPAISGGSYDSRQQLLAFETVPDEASDSPPTGADLHKIKS